MKERRSIIYIALNIVNHYVFVTFFKSWLNLSLVVLTVPVYQGCSKQDCSQDGSFTEMPRNPSVKLAVRLKQDTPVRSVDVLVFNDDLLQRTDCFQRFESLNDNTLLIGSCSGAKRIIICANPHWEIDEWRTVDSFHQLKGMKASLEKEDRSFPLMAAGVTIGAGKDTSDVGLERLSSIIRLNSVRCDFKGKPYDGEPITDARIYLTNVNGRCSISGDDFDSMESIINHGGLIRDDLRWFKDSTLIINHLGVIDTEGTTSPVELVCYPNTAEYESAGTPFTRLVIEGKIQGETWYWPININRGSVSDHEGILNNMTYSYDIVITRKGTKDPDIPITFEMAEIVYDAEKWTEKEEYQVAF